MNHARAILLQLTALGSLAGRPVDASVVLALTVPGVLAASQARPPKRDSDASEPLVALAFGR